MTYRTPYHYLGDLADFDTDCKAAVAARATQEVTRAEVERLAAEAAVALDFTLDPAQADE